MSEHITASSPDANKSSLELLRDRVRALDAALSAETAAVRRSVRIGRVLGVIFVAALILVLWQGHAALNARLGNAEALLATAERWADEELPALGATVEQSLKKQAPVLAQRAATELAAVPRRWRAELRHHLIAELSTRLGDELIKSRESLLLAERTGGPSSQRGDAELRDQVRGALRGTLSSAPPRTRDWLDALGTRLGELAKLRSPSPEERAAQEAAATLADLLARATAGSLDALPRERATTSLQTLCEEP